MSWVAQAGATNSSVASATSLTASAGARAVGEVICVSVSHDTFLGATTGVVDDNGAGLNTFVKVSSATDSSNFLILEEWRCTVAVAATIVVRVRYNPTPGTTPAGNCSLNVDPFTGSNAASVADGTGAAQLQPTPTTGADATTSGAWTTSTPGDLIHTSTVASATGANPGAVGTGFTLLQTSGGVILKSAYKVQAAPGSVAGLWTATLNDAHITAAMAITPAFSTGGIYTDQPRKDLAQQQRAA